MYDNIGAKIKSLAKVVFAVLAILSFLSGVLSLRANFLLGLFWMIGGPFLAWVSSWITYGFGEIVEKICSMESQMRASKPSAETDSESGAVLKGESQLERLFKEGLITEQEYKELLDKDK